MHEPAVDREIRAARNQSMFRAVNQQIRRLNETFAQITSTYSIACECADASCIEVLDIAPAEYEDIRRNPRRFAVLPGHVYPDVETVVRETESFVVVEKIGSGADLADEFASEPATPDG